jgi:cyclase
MQRERVTESIYVFTSDLYAQATAGVVLTEAGAVMVDTLVYPEETRQIRHFIENRLGIPVRYVINTHFHADHTTGTCFFEGVPVIAHRLCRELLDQRGRDSLEHAQASAPELRDVTLALPDVVFEGELTLYLGEKTFRFWESPGHSPDSIVCLVQEEQVLFAGDTLMPVPYFVDGSHQDFLASLQRLQGDPYEVIIQGHGEIILRGEIAEKIQEDIDYLVKLREAVAAALEHSSPEAALRAISIEHCGKSHDFLNGMVGQLHTQNVMRLADEMRQMRAVQFHNGQQSAT